MMSPLNENSAFSSDFTFQNNVGDDSKIDLPVLIIPSQQNQIIGLSFGQSSVSLGIISSTILGLWYIQNKRLS